MPQLLPYCRSCRRLVTIDEEGGCPTCCRTPEYLRPEQVRAEIGITADYLMLLASTTADES